MLADHGDGLSSSSFLAWSSIAQSVCQQAFSLLVNRYLRPWVRILPSAEEDNLSPLDSNIACLCQSIEINNNTHVWLRLLLKPDDPLTHKTIKCSSYCSCFKLMSDTFSISYHGPSLRDSKAVMLLLSLVLWANSTNPVITVEEDTKHLFLPVYHMTQQHATVWLQIMTNLQLLATRVCDYHVVMLWLYHPTTFISVKSTHLAQQHFQKYCASVSIHPTPLRGR